MRERMDKWKNDGTTDVVINLSEPAGPVFPGETLAANERIEVVKPGETIELEASHRRSVQDVWCSVCKKPIANEKCPSKSPRAVCGNEAHRGYWSCQGGQGMWLRRILDDGAEVAPVKMPPALTPPTNEYVEVRIPSDPDEALLARAREQIARRNGATS